MGGSQLSQLKSSLRASGLSRTSNPKDQRKRAKQRKDLSSASLAHRNSKLEAIHGKFNLFDVRDEKKKFEVVTRRGEVEGGKKGMPGRARAAGIEARKKTLLPMLEARTHSSTFLDHRFGETSNNLTPEEKALERFTAERQSRLGKKARFNLEDDNDEGGFELTHGGRKLGFGDEDELENGGWGGGGLGVSEGSNREPLLKRRKMGAEPEEEDEETPRKKTHAEIMNEVVAKSKFHKAERQKMKSADDETRLVLDAELKDLRAILGGSSRPPPPSASSSKAVPAAAVASDDEDDDETEDGELEGDSDEDGESGSEGSTYELNDEELEAALAASSSKSGVDRDLLRKLIGASADRSPSPPPAASTSAASVDDERPPPPKVDDEEKDPYDSYVRLLALEPRAHATNRLKTPLELAQQAAEELKAREEKRLKRQRGERDDSSDEEDGDGKKDRKGKGKRVPQADDLEDDYLEEGFEGGVGSDGESEGFGKGLEGTEMGVESEGEEEGSGEEGSDDEEDDEDEDNDDEMDVGDLSAEDEDGDAVEGEAEALVASSATAPAAVPTTYGKPELPYTFPCPTTHSEFVKLLTSSGIKEQDTPLVVKRIRTLYHPGLAEGNKEKLQVFANVLLDHVIYLSASPSSTTFRTINSLLPPLLTLSHAYPLTCAPHYVAKLHLMHKNFLRGLSRGPLDPASKTWPGLPELTLLRMVGMIWSTSDLAHPVSAAAQLLIGEYLAQARVRSLADLASGLFLCTVSTQYEELSKRLVPESTNFLVNTLLLLLPSSLTPKSFSGSFPTPDWQQDYVKSLKIRAPAKGDKKGVEPSKQVNLLDALKQGKKADGEEAEQLKIDLAKTAVALLADAREKYSTSEAFIELLQPVEAILKAVKLGKIPSTLKAEITTLLSSLTRSLAFATQSRKPLTLQQHRAIPIATYLPKFDEGFNPNRRFDPDSERAEASKLRALYKKEKKGAVRELRKDNRFLAVEEAKRKKQDDAAYEKKISKIMGSLQDERAEEKAFEREKSKGKRRDKARRT
ncbi:hypothetical protein JCM1841_006850 [Sporobolomyces salmonicolor]